MNIHLAQYSGFCFGVKRAIDMVCSFSDKFDKISTLGPIIHNSAVVDKLLSMGVTSIDDIDKFTGNLLVIRSHGVSPDVYEYCKVKGIEVADATCPYVKKIQRKVAESRGENIPIIIVGQPSHPETIGIIGWAGKNSVIIDSIKEALELPDIDQACIVSQTTTPIGKWESIVGIIKQKVRHLDIYNSICNATVQRQLEACELSKKCDLMFVVGGLNSSNTRKLYNICSSICNEVYHIQSKDDIPKINYMRYNDIGIISGASTPDWIIKEVFNTMSDIGKVDVSENISSGIVDEQAEGEDIKSQEQADSGYPEAEEENQENINAIKKENAGNSSFMEDVDNSMVTIRSGMVMTGKVVSVNENEICVNIGYKSDGIITRSEFSLDTDINPVDIIHEGDDIEVEVLKVRNEDGNVMLSTKNLEAKKHWKDLMDKYDNNESFQGVGKQAVKGGLIATINGVRAFVPASHIDIHYVNDISEYVGKTLDLKIIEVEKHRRRVVASRKAFVLAQEEHEKDKLWGQLDEGITVRGVVRRLTEFGAFVDIGGIDGLIHITDLAWGRVDHPSDVVKINDEIDVIILKVDKERSRVSLGYKQTKSKPWEIAEDKYPVDTIISGKVVRIVPFGAFVELEPGLDGLIHISQVSDKRIDKVEDVLQVGQEVEVKVLEINIPAKRISLSIRELMSKDQKDTENEQHESENEYYSDEDSVLVDVTNYDDEDGN